MSDAIQFLMERDRPFEKIAQNPLKTRVFTMSGEIPGISTRESQRKKADLAGFLRQYAQQRAAKPRFSAEKPRFSQLIPNRR